MPRKPNLCQKTKLTSKNGTYAKKTELTPKKPNLSQKNRTYSKKTELTAKKILDDVVFLKNGTLSLHLQID